ncbi:MAG: A/G-specific adenine glycosylase [Gemmatimonadota bacterium]
MSVTKKRIPKSKAKRRRKVDVSRARACLLDWYDAHRRDLPWRQDRDPYRVWVSEIMLQPTRVQAVTPCYQRWLQRSPALDSLARAGLHDVLKQWEGLGYYSRARNLHGAARNVRRVLSRVFDVAAPNTAAVRRQAEALIDPDRPGDFNQALMELGATICTPRNPRCAVCPLQSLCLAHANGTTAQRPGRNPKKPIPHEQVNSVVLLREQQVFLAQRPDNGLLAGLWEFPETAEPPAGATIIGEVSHTFSHKRVTYTVYYIEEDWLTLTDGGCRSTS